MNNDIKIQVLGAGCQTCKKLFELTKQAVKELGIDSEVEYITDIQKIIEMGIIQTPVLIINSKTILVGSGFDLEKIKNKLGEIKY